ncbi:MAG: hypothetical protein JXR65_07835 [Bacteroidales bacterium]|nr:hypothetical protein [Bacteroidales bacterium]
MKANHVSPIPLPELRASIVAVILIFVFLPMAVQGQSAIGQLEKLTGQKISKSGSSAKMNSLSYKNAMKIQLATGIASAFLSFIFSDNTKNNQAAIQQAALLAKKAAAEKHFKDSVAQVKYEQMMQSYKKLDDGNTVHFKTLSSTGSMFKTLSQSAPMTQAEIERQKIMKQGINITWDYNSWSVMQQNKISDIPPTFQQEIADQYMDQAINKIETFQGGKIAALSGRFMMNIKKESMSYMKDAADAVTSGDVYKMEELGQIDLRKMSSNAIINTAKQTADAYFEQGKGYLTGMVKDKNFGLLTSGSKTALKNYGIYSKAADDWKVSIKKY